MGIIKLKRDTDANGNLELTIPTEQKNKQVEVLITLTFEEDLPRKPNLNLFFGKLQWKGNALAEQQRLRNEWS